MIVFLRSQTGRGYVTRRLTGASGILGRVSWRLALRGRSATERERGPLGPQRVIGPNRPELPKKQLRCGWHSIGNIKALST
jgi:hypothetical protein